jgi:hypothetical protein
VSLPHDYSQDFAGIEAPVLLIQGRYDRMVAFEISIAFLNHIADWHLVFLKNCGALAAVREAGRVGRAGPRVPAGLLRGTAIVKTRSARLLGGEFTRDPLRYRLRAERGHCIVPENDIRPPSAPLSGAV